MHEGGESADSLIRPGGGVSTAVVNLVLGSIVLFVGQTTFQHAGELSGIHHQIKAIEDRFDHIVSDLNQRTEDRFTQDDGERFARRINHTEETLDSLKYSSQEKISQISSRLAVIQENLARHEPLLTPGRFEAAPSVQMSERLISELWEVRRQLDQINRAVGQNNRRIERVLQVGHTTPPVAPPVSNRSGLASRLVR